MRVVCCYLFRLKIPRFVIVLEGDLKHRTLLAIYTDTTLKLLSQQIDQLHPHVTKIGQFLSLQVYSLRSEEHTSELQSRGHLVCRLLLEKKKKTIRCTRH